MFLGTVSSWTSVSGSNIPFVTVSNTNDKTSNSSGTISILKNGYYNIDGSLSLVNSGSSDIATTVSVYADGSARTSTAQTVTVPAGLTSNISITDALKVIISSASNTATVGVVVGTSGLSTSGVLRIEYVR